MFVNQYKINDTELSGTTGYTINIGANQNEAFVGQQEIIDTKFIDVEVEKAVNVTFDYEKVKILPKFIYPGGNSVQSSQITYVVNISGATASGFYNPTTWGDLGLNADEKFDLSDFKFKKKAFTKSFLRLDFYDSDIATNQNLVSFMTLYPKFSHADIAGAKASGLPGNVPDVNTYPVQFTLGDTTVDRMQNGEGFSLYYFKDEIIPTVPKHLYMKATFNNAKDGRTIGLMSSSSQTLSIDDLMKTTMGTTIKNNLYTRYILTRDTNGYFYEIDWTYSFNVNYVSGRYKIDLYQIDAK